jgi:hypothetical protein
MTAQSAADTAASRAARPVPGGLGGGGAAPFTPATISGLQLWLDASDSATVLNSISPDTPATNGQTVRRWLDKSGNGFHANQATGANQPLLDTSAQNSKGGLSFDGTNDVISAAVVGIGSLANVTFYSVIKPLAAAAPNSGSVNLYSFGNAGTASGPYPANRFIALLSSTGTLTGEYIFAAYEAGATQLRLGSSTYRRAADTAQIICDNRGASGTSLAVNGSAVTLDLSSGGTTSTSTSPSNLAYTIDEEVHINGNRANGTLFSGPANRCLEFLIYNKILSSEEDAQILSYLNTKWAVY